MKELRRGFHFRISRKDLGGEGFERRIGKILSGLKQPQRLKALRSGTEKGKAVKDLSLLKGLGKGKTAEFLGELAGVSRATFEKVQWEKREKDLRREKI